MAKRKEPDLPIFSETILQQPLEEVIHSSMMPYAEYVILERALPRVEDGLKPVQRRILYTMQDLGNTPDKPHRKSARIVGDCLGKYHPHGDSSVYEAMVRMSQPFVMRAPLVDGHGNFGSIDGDSAAAPRYTEVRMTNLALALLKDIEKDTVPFRLNFDDSLKEPDMLPGRFPNLLVNGAAGIAVGLATNVPPHNLREAIDCVIAQMENPDITLQELMTHLKGPDFPTGGILLATDELKQAYATGRGKLTVRAKLSIEDGSNGRKLIVITEMPYQVAKAAMLEKILKVSEEKKGALSSIYDIRDESDRTGLRAVIELKKDADIDKVMAMLYKYTDLQTTFGVNIVAIADGKPKQLPLKELNDYYIRHQKTVVTRRTKYELEQAKAREHILLGLMIAVDNLDAILALIRASKNGKEAREGLMKNYGLSEIQAQAILDLRLQRLTGLEILALRKEYEEIKALIAKLEGILQSEKKLLAVIKKEMLEIRDAYGDDRRTEIITESAEIPKELLSTPEEAQEAIVILTRAGFLKRLSPKIFNAGSQSTGQSGGTDPAKSIAEIPRKLIETQTDKRLLMFTTKGNCYPLNAGQIPECKLKDRGVPLAGILPGYEESEQVCAMLTPAQDEELLFFTSKGMIKRTRAEEYFVRKSKYAAINLKADDALISVQTMLSENSILLVTRRGMSINFPMDFGATGRTTGGVRAIALDRADSVIFAAQTNGEGELLLVSDRGYIKRSLIVDYDLQGRGGKGLKTFQWAAGRANGEMLTGILHVREPLTFAALQKGGAVTMLNSDEIAIEHRFSKGKPYIMVLLEDVITEVVCI